MRQYHVYIMASLSKALYVGVTSNLELRVQQHKDGRERHTAKYHINRLVYVEETPDMVSAIRRERQIKGWTRAKKVALIESVNPGWADLAESWFAAHQ
jgi:putative endonuclease